ncbi:hypothetical protein DSECCO2_265410 [anaerobic digester metagenome]
MDLDKLVEQIIDTEIEKIPGTEDKWEKHIYIKENVFIVGYKENEGFYDDNDDGTHVKSYSWYWELRNADTWDVLHENHDGDFTFCTDPKECTWSDQDLIEDIADVVAEESLRWFELEN